MQCKEALQAVLDAKYAGRSPPDEALEVLKCDECRELLERSQRLDILLSFDEAHTPGPGFDTRFFARLEEKKKKPDWRWLLAMFGTLSVGTAAAVFFLISSGGKTPSHQADSALELAVVEELELLEELEVVEQLEEVEVYDLLAAVDAETLERLIEEEGP